MIRIDPGAKVFELPNTLSEWTQLIESLHAVYEPTYRLSVGVDVSSDPYVPSKPYLTIKYPARVNPVLVSNLRQAEELRKVRNACCKFMTHYPHEISEEEQVRWFETLDKENFLPFLVYVDNEIIGYCTLVFRDGVVWLTGGLYEEYRNQGFGRQVFEWMVVMAKSKGWENIMLDVAKNNPIAHRLYLRVGFVDVDETDDLWIMRYEECSF